MIAEQLALDLRSGAERDAEGLIALFRQHMSEDWRNPGRFVWKKAGPYTDAEKVKGVRCLRCGMPIYEYDRVINHDLGWCGCPDGRAGGFHQFAGAEEMNAGRAELEAFPACADCGHAWGLHATHLIGPPATSHEGYCYTWCGCRRYVAPAFSATPWGTCPGCWREPHEGTCS
jgi:hypothetical protein